jgi:hypothetical protein
MNNLDDIFTIIGKLYVDVYNSQKIIDVLQQQIKDKDQEINRLQQPKDMNE